MLLLAMALFFSSSIIHGSICQQRVEDVERVFVTSEYIKRTGKSILLTLVLGYFFLNHFYSFYSLWTYSWLYSESMIKKQK